MPVWNRVLENLKTSKTSENKPPWKRSCAEEQKCDKANREALQRKHPIFSPNLELACRLCRGGIAVVRVVILQ
jgi:hypothetical protein